jgi:FdhD protein
MRTVTHRGGGAGSTERPGMIDRTEYAVIRLLPDGAFPDSRIVPVEAPIAVEFNGIGYAVMMATPVDLEDFGTGFALSEGIVGAAGEIEEIEAHETPQGWLLKIRIVADQIAPMIERVRVRVSESSCGLCGLENLEQVCRPLSRIAAGAMIETKAMFAALDALADHQALNRATGGAHVAAFCDGNGQIMFAREDVGRHCALDKLVGAMARAGVSPRTGFFLLSSRCSYELVEKAVVAGCPTLVTVSTATSLAIERARSAGLRLVALARPDAMLDMAAP